MPVFGAISGAFAPRWRNPENMTFLHESLKELFLLDL